MALEYTYIQEKLEEKFGAAIKSTTVIQEMLTVELEASKNLEAIEFLKSDPKLRFNFLTDVCGVHYPDHTKDRQFAVVYHMHNWMDNVRMRIKCFLPGDQPEIESVTAAFLSANWQERETYDFYGITFKNHPQLKRILNMDEMTSFPLRKEFPMEDGGRTDKDDRFFGRTSNCN
ncbi:MAG: NADH-quinone oxidoreductase subunit C [Flavobacterium sp.]|nr:NADH-quinone oxidoreductase subunit C [Candidatus Neoflavobacterium equi]